MTKVLVLDLDGVVYRWHSAVYEYFKLYKDYQGTYNRLWSIDHKYIKDSEWEFLTNIDFLYSCECPTPDCLSFLDNVKYRFDIYYVTNRPDYVKLTTEQYLRRYKFPFRYNLIFTQDKVNTARRLQADYFLEDRIDNAEALRKVTNVVLMAQPYNKEHWDTFNTAHSLMGALQFLES